MFAVADERRDARLAVCGDGRQLSRRRRIRACSRAARIAADAACGWRLVGSRHSDDPGQDDRDCRTRSMHRNSGKEGNRGTAAQGTLLLTCRTPRGHPACPDLVPPPPCL
eukprot:scaffold6084_cov112-Isochrysis_galbana.AAC.3